GFRGGGAGDWSGDSNLALPVIPEEVDAGVRMLGEREALSTVIVGIEADESVGRVDKAAEDNARRGCAVWLDGGEGHGVGVGLFPRRDGLIEPGLKNGERICREWIREGASRSEACDKGWRQAWGHVEK